MKKYLVQVGGELDKMLQEGARRNNITIEKFITQILSRYIISPHILDSEEAKKAYSECGEINLEWANL